VDLVDTVTELPSDIEIELAAKNEIERKQAQDDLNKKQEELRQAQERLKKLEEQSERYM
jgi:hypothetical protein